MKIYRDSLPSSQVIVRLAGSTKPANFYLNPIEQLVISNLSLTVTSSSIEVHWDCSHEDNTRYVVLDEITGKYYNITSRSILFSNLSYGESKKLKIQAFNSLYDASVIYSIEGSAVPTGIGTMIIGSTFIVGGKIIDSGVGVWKVGENFKIG